MRNVAGVADQILGAQQALDVGQRETGRGHLRPVRLDEDLLGAGPADADLADAGYDHELAAQIISVVGQLVVTVAVTGHGHEDAEDVAKVVDDPRRAGSRRQPTAHVVDFAPHLVPDLRQVMFSIDAAHLHLDLRHPVA